MFYTVKEKQDPKKEDLAFILICYIGVEKKQHLAFPLPLTIPLTKPLCQMHELLMLLSFILHKTAKIIIFPHS